MCYYPVIAFFVVTPLETGGRVSLFQDLIFAFKPICFRTTAITIHTSWCEDIKNVNKSADLYLQHGKNTDSGSFTKEAAFDGIGK